MSGAVPVAPDPLPPPPPLLPWEVPVSAITDIATFRAAFPEFADPALYPDAQVQAYLDVGSVLAGPRWGNLRQTGAHLVAAHMLSLSRYAQLRAGGGNGAAPGINTGLLTSKSVSKVSVGYDVSSVMVERGGPWNYTAYGSQYLWLMNLIGTGGYETLAVGYGASLVGTVQTWARGVQIGWLAS